MGPPLLAGAGAMEPIADRPRRHTASTRPLLAIPSAALPLSGEWRFVIDPASTGQTSGWFQPEFDDSPWAVVTVPHTWNVTPDLADYEGLAWYRRRFIPPAGVQDAHLRLRFEAVFYLAHVWLNGEYLGGHEGGYTPFAWDVSGLVKPDAENTIAVQVDNRRTTNRIPATVRSDWSFDWWNYGGIVRGVTLHLSSRAFIAHLRIVAVPQLSAAHTATLATITTTATIRNTSTDTFDGILSGDVVDDVTGMSVLSAPPVSAVTLMPGDSADVQLCTTVSHPKLWHFDHPHLYSWAASLHTPGGQPLHTSDVRFGVRAVELRNAQLHLNGEAVRLVGLTRHADSPEHGLAETITVMAADYADLKTLNTVLSRPTHYPQAEFILDYADRAGILLMPEVPAWQLTAEQMDDPHMRELQRQQLREMIAAQGHHPSVWAWSLGNEFESKTREGHAFVRDMKAYVKSLDPTRPVGFASNLLNSRPGDDATALADFVLLNQYFGTWSGPKDRLGPALDAIHTTWPDKPVIISEYGFEPGWERLLKGPVLRRSRYYLLPKGGLGDSDAADIQRRRLISEQMAVLRTKPFVAGAIFWTYQDYRTPTNYRMGVVDARRRRRGSWAVLREEYSPVLFDSVSFAPRTASPRGVVVVLRTRGPVDNDMPAYTVRGYRLHWMVVGAQDQKLLSQGNLLLPTLSTGTTWSTRVEWPVPAEEYVVTLRVIRPTGLIVTERSYDARGDRRHGPRGGS
jgi:beta-galactosidase/beta-glucuronidase